MKKITDKKELEISKEKKEFLNKYIESQRNNVHMPTDLTSISSTMLDLVYKVEADKEENIEK